MVDLYQTAAGWNNEAGLTTVDPQPMCPGYIEIPSDAISGAAYGDEPYTIWRYSMIESVDALQALLTAFGLTAARYSLRTFRTRAYDREFANFNGIIHRPIWTNDIVWSEQFPRDADFIIKKLVELS